MSLQFLFFIIFDLFRVLIWLENDWQGSMHIIIIVKNYTNWNCVTMLSKSEIRLHEFSLLLVGLSSMKRYPNGALTRTCSMVRGPDEKPEVGRQRSEYESMVVSSSSGFETSQFFVAIDPCALQKGSILPDQWKGKSGTTCVSSTNVRAFIYTKTGFRTNTEERSKVLASCLLTFAFILL